MKPMTCTNGDITLAYDTVGTADGQPLLLIAPLGAMSRLAYHDDFCAALVNRGFQVARFDNRDAGAATHLDPSARYDLADMAGDAAAVLDALRWPAAHIVGASLGAMIGQVMAVRHASRVRTLTSIAGAARVSWRGSRPKLRTVFKVLALNRHLPTNAESSADYHVKLYRLIGSPGYPLDERSVRDAARKVTVDPPADARHIAAMRASGDRRVELSRVTAPTLVLHGEADPLQSLNAARETADAIPGARLVTYPGMGHDLPRALWPDIVTEITTLAERADTRVN